MNFELTAEQREFQRIVHDFVDKEVRPHARHVDETGEFNWAAVRKMGPMGMLGLQVPEAYGGAGARPPTLVGVALSTLRHRRRRHHLGYHAGDHWHL